MHFVLIINFQGNTLRDTVSFVRFVVYACVTVVDIDLIKMIKHFVILSAKTCDPVVTC